MIKPLGKNLFETIDSIKIHRTQHCVAWHTMHFDLIRLIFVAVILMHKVKEIWITRRKKPQASVVQTLNKKMVR